MKQTLILILLLIASFVQGQLPIKWTFDNQIVPANTPIVVEFKVDNFINIAAYQFALKFDTSALEFNCIEPIDDNKQPVIKHQDILLGRDFSMEVKGDTASPISITGNLPHLGQGCFSWYGRQGYNLTPGEMRTVYSYPYGDTLSNGTVVFKVNLITKKATNLCTTVHLWTNHSVLKPLAYTQQLKQRMLTLDCLSAISKLQNELALRNQTSVVNTVQPTVTCSDVLVTSNTPVDVTVIHSTGRVISFNKNVTNIRLELPVNGLYFVQVGTKTYKVTRY